MKTILFTISFLTALLFSNQIFAGTPQLNLNCKGVSENASITGFPRGEGFDLSIKIGSAVTRYVDICEDVNCNKHPKQGDLAVVEALNKKVFTIYFSWPEEGGALFMGYFYALPDTVKYTKTSKGYRAEYHALYDGTDPRSKEFPIGQVKSPIEFTCTQDEEL